MMSFFEGLMERQEAMQQRFLEAMEKRDQDRMIREEALRRQEMACLAREQEVLAQERAMATARNAGVLSLIQKITGQTIPLPSMPPPPPSSHTHATHIADAAAPPPSSQQPQNTQPQHSPRPRKPPTMPLARQSTFDKAEEAARAYDAAALWLYGASAKTNVEQSPTGATADGREELPGVKLEHL
jgi:hypothetical protein